MKSIVFHNFVLRALQESSGSVYFVWVLCFRIHFFSLKKKKLFLLLFVQFILRVANQVEPQRRSDTLGVHGWTECITIFLRSHSEQENRAREKQVTFQFY